MKWFKKLFSKLQEDDYDGQIEEQHIERLTDHRKEQKDLETRIVYQYPKGKFKFPIIPDDKETLQRQRKPREERIQSRRQPEEMVHIQKTLPPKPKVTEVTRKEPPKREVSKRPFRPTEIPSPVYGFEKRVRNEVKPPVEYELNSFMPKDYIEPPIEMVEVKRLEKNRQKIGNNEETVINSDRIELTSMDAKVEVTGSQVEETSNITNTLDLKHGSETTAEIDRDNDEIATTIEIVTEEKMEQNTDVINTIQMVGETPSKRTEEAANTEKLIHNHDHENVSEVEWDNDEITTTVELASEEVEESVEVLEQDGLVVETSEPTPIVYEEELKQEDEVNSLGELEEQKLAEEEPIDAPPKRKHLPFNVLMLSEDRRKLQEKKKVEQIKLVVEEPVQSIPLEPVVTALEPEVEEDSPYYVFPSLDLLSPPVIYDTSGQWLEERERLLNDTLESFNVRASVVNVTQGPSVTRFEVQPEPGVKVNKITNLADDIKLSLAAKDIRIEAPIPGKHTIGIEVPNEVSRPVLISEIVNSPEFLHSASPLTAVLGLDISGKPIVTDLRKMPHGLIAGATGSGKSVCINTILVSLLYRARPDELKLLLIDPKMVELAPYNQIPHLVSPVITDVKAATAALKWAVEEMERRYELFAHSGVREINRFNELCEQHKQYGDKLPFIVIIIDELADLMMMAPADVEEAICRIAQKARACGIHLIIATQRPSVDVITGLIKANVPTRIAFSVSSQIDSRTIIDIAGAERLLGRGDMLFLENGSSKPVRLQGTFVSDEEIDQVVAHVRREQGPNYLFHQEELLKRAAVSEEEDELFFEACEFVVDQGSASTSSLQRRFKIGYNRAARLIDMMEKNGYISENRGSKPRDVLIDEDDLQSIQES